MAIGRLFIYQRSHNLQNEIKNSEKINILIVDDDEFDRELIKRTLSKSHLRVNIQEETSVDGGLKALKKGHFDLVLLDYRLPQRDGIEMLVELRASPKNKSIAIIVMSSSTEEELALKCITEGAQDFLIKSEITVSRLRAAILHSQIRFDLEKELYASYEKVKALSETDPLTGLANRSLFDQTLKAALASNPRSGSKVALLLIDIDRFKYINDTYGHNVGDQFLVKLVQLLRECLRNNEFIARLGGDEFGVILTNVRYIDHVNHIAVRINHALSQQIQVDKYTIRPSASIGISIYPDNGHDNLELFKQADIAMYRSKKLGRNQACFFEERLQKSFQRRVALESRLTQALQQNEFFLVYQPIYEPKEEKLLGFEALLRWKSGAKQIYPNEFIPVAEETRQIIEIGSWVMKEALRQLSEWTKTFSEPITMSVNVSTIQLNIESFAFEVIKELEHLEIPSSQLEIEITETALIQDTESVHRNLEILSDYGCRISLDDFGTGYSSVSHLQLFPINILKIDRSLMPSSITDSKNYSLIEGVCLLANVLGLIITAEGLETDEQLILCKKLGVPRAQGYFFSKPLPKDDISNKYFPQ